MMLNDENKRNMKKLLSGRFSFIALGVCVLAAGVVGYTVTDRTKQPSTVIESTTEKTTYISINEPQTKLPEETSPLIEEIIPDVTEPSDIPTEAVFEDSGEQETVADEAPASYVLPLNNGISADFSMGIPVYSSTMADYRTHNGVDFKASAGESVMSIADGVVISVTKDDNWGNTVQMQHSGGVVSTISGFADEGLVYEGASVSAGDVIGVVGPVPVEAKDGEHIHLEIRVNNELADPLEIMGYSENTAE